MSAQLLLLQKVARDRRAASLLGRRRRFENALAVAFVTRTVAILARQIPKTDKRP